jgi:hypothetical protein
MLITIVIEGGGVLAKVLLTVYDGKGAREKKRDFIYFKIF